MPYESRDYMLLYGLSTVSLAYQIGKSVDDAQDLLDDYFDQFPTVREWMDSITDQSMTRRRITFWSGRVWYPFQDKHYQSINAAVQGSSADLTSLAAVQINKYLLTSGYGSILSIVHDEFLLSLSNTNCIDDIQEIMGMEKLFGMKFTTDVDILSSYGE